MASVLKGSHSFTCTPRVHPLTEWTMVHYGSFNITCIKVLKERKANACLLHQKKQTYLLLGKFCALSLETERVFNAFDIVTRMCTIDCTWAVNQLLWCLSLFIRTLTDVRYGRWFSYFPGNSLTTPTSHLVQFWMRMLSLSYLLDKHRFVAGFGSRWIIC